MNKIIRSETEYRAALGQIEKLIDLNAAPKSPEGERLDLLTLLVREYENNKYGEIVPDPIEAIKFRMEQANLTPRDLVPFLGSRSKVSEVLARKRPLTLSMIKALHSGLGIPAKALLQDEVSHDTKSFFADWQKFPLKEMVKRGWVTTKFENLETQGEAILRRFFEGLGVGNQASVFYRRTTHIRAGRQMDKYAIAAWTARIILLASENPPPNKYKAGSIDQHLMRELAKLSVFDTGPRLAQEFLGKRGVSLIIEPHLAGTYLDGAAVLVAKGQPVIGLTLRHDRVDNFWFSLMHELAHVVLHLNEETSQFYDDLEVEAEADAPEREADKFAVEALVPEAEWRKSPASRLRSAEAVEHLAQRLGVHPAIVAGHSRYRFKSFHVLNRLVGHGQIRKLFPEYKWEA
jgi:HTH-type transcriptional regulator / antitoxin HigA